MIAISIPTLRLYRIMATFTELIQQATSLEEAKRAGAYIRGRRTRRAILARQQAAQRPTPAPAASPAPYLPYIQKGMPRPLPAPGPAPRATPGPPPAQTPIPRPAPPPPTIPPGYRRAEDGSLVPETFWDQPVLTPQPAPQITPGWGGPPYAPQPPPDPLYWQDIEPYLREIEAWYPQRRQWLGQQPMTPEQEAAINWDRARFWYGLAWHARPYDTPLRQFEQYIQPPAWISPEVLEEWAPVWWREQLRRQQPYPYRPSTKPQQQAQRGVRPRI